MRKKNAVLKSVASDISPTIGGPTRRPKKPNVVTVDNAWLAGIVFDLLAAL